ncbi:hypothetical protein [Pseudomonas oryzihabitans]|uniref:hypothetical protein n=1 Tax=Pseudomonas oryzihabitans TaxID=47885 RepID=UPI00119D2E40|nr:hypothetical protein [Pseudomonas oryzihabitans]
MSDEEKPVSSRVSRLAAFTRDTFVDHVDRNGGLNPCEGCGSTDWTMALKENGKPDLLSPPLFSSESVYLLLPVTCGKCGNVRLFNVGMIANIVDGENDA